MYPLDIPYEELLINQWIEDTEVKLIESGCDFNLIQTGFWYLINYSEQLVNYDKTLFEKYYIPRLELIWEIIDNIKIIKKKYDNDFIEKYLNCDIYNTLSTLSTDRNNRFKKPENHEEICYVLNECIEKIKELEKTEIDFKKFEFEISLKKTRVKKNNVIENNVIEIIDF